ncbi:MAG: hypothetical protein MJY80_06075 [Bacteroidales bacterium]|nr:hypothetical protein [Bacteroidales bacterium]
MKTTSVALGSYFENFIAQPYKNAVGISFGPNWTGPDHNLGVQWNHFLSEKTNLDVRALYNFNWGPIFEGLYEWDVYIGEGGVRFYGGPGVHFGFKYCF